MRDSSYPFRSAVAKGWPNSYLMRPTSFIGSYITWRVAREAINPTWAVAARHTSLTLDGALFLSFLVFRCESEGARNTIEGNKMHCHGVVMHKVRLSLSLILQLKEPETQNEEDEEGTSLSPQSPQATFCSGRRQGRCMASSAQISCFYLHLFS